MSILSKLLAAHPTTQSSTPTNPLDDPAVQRTLAELSKPLILRRLERYITQDPATQDMLRHARLMAFRREPVLITGETGTGKEILAQVMLGDRPHNNSVQNFYPVNCAGIVDTLFESLLFGHTAGAFTDAKASRPGLLVAAKSGVVFFDELGELPLSQQAKLLRVLQSKLVTPVGSTIETEIKCRFVFATNRNLEKMVAAGHFREDLWYRISSLELHTIPLRDRPDDAPIIADAICLENDWSLPECSIPSEVVNSPGNVRALEKWLLRHHVLGE